jgi:hypothetical protein
MKKYVLNALAVLALSQTLLAAELKVEDLPLPANLNLTGQEFFVQNTAPDDGNGEKTRPFNTIAAAIKRVHGLPNNPENPPSIFIIATDFPYRTRGPHVLSRSVNILAEPGGGKPVWEYFGKPFDYSLEDPEDDLRINIDNKGIDFRRINE